MRILALPGFSFTSESAKEFFISVPVCRVEKICYMFSGDEDHATAMCLYYDRGRGYFSKFSLVLENIYCLINRHHII